jgi:hypothetical protein
VVGRRWQSLNQHNYYKSAAYTTKNLTDNVAHKTKCNTVLYNSHLVTVAWEKAEASDKLQLLNNSNVIVGKYVTTFWKEALNSAVYSSTLSEGLSHQKHLYSQARFQMQCDSKLLLSCPLQERPSHL